MYGGWTCDVAAESTEVKDVPAAGTQTHPDVYGTSHFGYQWIQVRDIVYVRVVGNTLCYLGPLTRPRYYRMASFSLLGQTQ